MANITRLGKGTSRGQGEGKGGEGKREREEGRGKGIENGRPGSQHLSLKNLSTGK